jgi:hypothetical protein
MFITSTRLYVNNRVHEAIEGDEGESINCIMNYKKN